jgi:hypothetical protein
MKQGWLERSRGEPKERMKIDTNIHLLSDPEGHNTLEVFRGITRWCSGTLLDPEKTKVSILVSDDLGIIERLGKHYRVVVFVCNDKSVQHTSYIVVSTTTTLEFDVNRALAKFEREEVGDKN